MNQSGPKPMTVDRARLGRLFERSNRIGATEAGGLHRLALTDTDRHMRDQFCEWGRERGYSVRVDALGNIALQRPGRDPGRAPVVAGSHLDTQPYGGRFDGIFGVLAALEALMACDDAGIETQAPLEAICWTNEEGARFAPAMMGSAVFTGQLGLDQALAIRDRQGVSVGEALEAIGYRGGETPGYPLDTYFEAHIEQGPVLERAGELIGAVSGAQGQLSYNVVVTGRASHSGTTPMSARQDAMVAAAAMVLAARDAATAGEHTVATVGALEPSPGTRNTIAARVWFTIDVRDPDQATLDRLDAHLRTELPRLAAVEGCRVDLERILTKPPELFDPALVSLITACADALDLPHRRMVSGAGHDACHVSRVAPSAMIFIPCRSGVSHNEEEHAEPNHLAAGADVLATAMVARAGLAS